MLPFSRRPHQFHMVQLLLNQRQWRKEFSLWMFGRMSEWPIVPLEVFSAIRLWRCLVVVSWFSWWFCLWLQPDRLIVDELVRQTIDLSLGDYKIAEKGPNQIACRYRWWLHMGYRIGSRCKSRKIFYPCYSNGRQSLSLHPLGEVVCSYHNVLDLSFSLRH